MYTQLQPDSNIPLEIYQLASKHNLGTPLKRNRGSSLEITYLIRLIFGVLSLGWLVYIIYGYIAFIVLSHIYPNANVVPADQLNNYFWLQTIHDEFWSHLLAPLTGLLSLIAFYARFLVLRQTKFYVCTEGLLKTYKKSDDGVRWNEIKELITDYGTVTKLIRRDESTFTLSTEKSNLSVDKKFNNLITDNVTHCLLPIMLERYEQGETTTFGDLGVNQKGIYRPGGRLYWEQIGDITLKKNKLAIYYNIASGNRKEQYSLVIDDKWQTWRKDVLDSKSWPNIPIFVAMVNAILNHQDARQIRTAQIPQQPHVIPEAVLLMKRRSQKRQQATILSIIVTVLVIISLFTGLIIHENDQEQLQKQAQQAQAAKDIMLMQNHFTQLAHQAYTVHVPGEQCGNGKNFWLDDDSKNSYICKNNGLLMTQHNQQYMDEEDFTFEPDTLSTEDTFASINDFPHNYRVQVLATIPSDEPGTCVSMIVHMQNFQGGQWFSICADGTWYYSIYDLKWNTSVDLDNGNLAHSSYSYLFRVDVSDTLLSLYVNNTKVTTIHDTTYHNTSQLAMGVYGDTDAKKPAMALFSDFTYTPAFSK